MAFVLLFLFLNSGASCVAPFYVAAGPPIPQVLPADVSRDQLIATIDQAANRVQSYVTHTASIRLKGMVALPALSGTIAFRRPQEFRLTAGTAITGTEIDVGSNHQEYWFWARQNEPPALYVGRHGLGAWDSQAMPLPIQPEWIPSALGMGQMGHLTEWSGPTPQADGKVELRAKEQSNLGTLSRVFVVDVRRALILEQHIYRENGELLLTTKALRHQYFPTAGVALPNLVEIHVPPARTAFTVDVGTLQINQDDGTLQTLFAIPNLAGYPRVDLTNSAGVSGILPNGPFLAAGSQIPLQPQGALNGRPNAESSRQLKPAKSFEPLTYRTEQN